jgi:hypothetical protein
MVWGGVSARGASGGLVMISGLGTVTGERRGGLSPWVELTGQSAQGSAPFCFVLDEFALFYIRFS